MSVPWSLSCRQIGDRLHHGVADAGVVEDVAGAIDDADFAAQPARGECMRGCGRAQQIVAALHQDAGNAGELAGLVPQLMRSLGQHLTYLYR